MKKCFAFGFGLLSACAATAALDPRVPNIFTGNVMTNESVAFMGTDDAASLMYAADEIISVRSSTLVTTFEEGVDWTFDKSTRRIQLTPNTRITYYTEAEYYPETGKFSCCLPGRKYVLFGEGATMHTNQVWVTYRHSDGWDGPAPRSDAAAFAPLMDDLFGFSSGNILFYGDSITTGSNSSGTIGQKPSLPGWPKQVYSAIVDATGNRRLKYVNTAVGGMTSTWGVQNVQSRVIAYSPKLVVVAFGMNDGDATSAYTNRISKIVAAIHEALPETSVLLVSPMIPNPEANGFHEKGLLFPEYETALAGLVDEYRAAGFARIGLANVTTTHGAVLERKRFRDISGNNINHCNDFSARIYRDTILASLGVVDSQSALNAKAKTPYAWFDGGVYADWPEDAAMTGGAWQNASASFFDGERIYPKASAAQPLAFVADAAAPLAKSNVVISVRAGFTLYTEPPPAPQDAATGVIAVHEGFATNYFVLVEGANGANVWRRLPDSAATTDEEVQVQIKVRRSNGRILGSFVLNSYVSPEFELLDRSSLQRVTMHGTGCAMSLTANVLPGQSGLILQIR